MTLKAKLAVAALITTISSVNAHAETTFSPEQQDAINSAKTFNTCIADKSLADEYAAALNTYSTEIKQIDDNNEKIYQEHIQAYNDYKDAKKKYFDENGITEILNDYREKLKNEERFSYAYNILYVEYQAFELSAINKFEEETGLNKPENPNYQVYTPSKPNSPEMVCRDKAGINQEILETLYQLSEEHPDEYLEAINPEILEPQ